MTPTIDVEPDFGFAEPESGDNGTRLDMKVDRWLKTNVEESRELIGSGYQGVNRAVKHALDDEGVRSDLSSAAHNAWKAATIGACVGSISGYLSEDEKPVQGALAGALLGGALALGGLMVWGSRRLIAAAATGAAKNVKATRDEQWLEHNPVAYG